MRIITEESVHIAAECLQKGGLVAFPTETVYGLGANALDPMAVAGIFEAKQRPSFDPLIVHICRLEQISELFASPINLLVFDLAKHFWPGPLTIVHQKSENVPGLVTSDMDTVAVRMPAHPLALKLLEAAMIPVAAPSANKFGQLSPTHFEHVAKQGMQIDYLLAGNDDEEIVGIESTVVFVENNKISILRPGIITADDLRDALPEADIQIPGENIKLSSPGLLKSHYSPLKPTFFYNHGDKLPHQSGLILHSKETSGSGCKEVLYTSADGNLVEVAANLFSTLHKMEDNPNVKQIYIEPVAETGIGIAIMDRLKKATYQYKEV